MNSSVDLSIRENYLLHFRYKVVVSYESKDTNTQTKGCGYQSLVNTSR